MFRATSAAVSRPPCRSAGSVREKRPQRRRKTPAKTAARITSESAAHVLPLHDLVVDLAQAAADHPAEQVEELQRRVRVHRQDLVERGAVDGEHRGVAVVRLRVGAARLVVDEGHLAEEVAAVEHRQRLFADAGDELGDAHAAVEDDVELVALLPLAEDHRPLAEPLLGRERRQQLHFPRGEAALAEEVDFVLRLDRDFLHLALAAFALAAAALLRVLLKEELELLVGVAHFHGQRAPEGPVQADGELLVLVHELVERAERQRVAGRRPHGDGVAGAVRAVDEVHLAEDRVGAELAEELRAERRGRADVDLAVAHDVEVHRALVLAKYVPALAQRLDARELRQMKELLVLHVLEDAELPQLRGDLDEVVALLGVARDLLEDGAHLALALDLEKRLLAQLQALGAELELLDALLDPRVQLLRLDVLDALQGVDHAPHRLGGVALLVCREEERVDEVVEGLVEVLELEFDAAGDLREAAVEGVELARPGDLLVGLLPFALRVVETAEDLVGAVVVRRLQLGDLEELDGFRGLVLGHVVLREAGVLRGVDLVARALGVDFVLHRREPRLLGSLLEIADAREVDAHGHGAGLELLRHLVEVDRLVVHPLVGVAAGQGDEVVGVDGDGRLPRHGEGVEPRARRSDGLLGHRNAYYSSRP